jgi:hypothetical protein
VWAVIDEAALRRLTGGAGVMRAQIDHLLEISERRHVGGHAGAGGPLRILRFPRESEVPDIVFLEQLTRALYLDNPADVDDYLAAMELLCVQALRPRKTRAALEAIPGELRLSG